MYRLAKALWFKHLDPVIPEVIEEGVDEEEYDDYDENIYEEVVDTEREEDRMIAGKRRREPEYEEEYLEESVVPGPSQAGEYVYEADEEGEDWDGYEEEGDYEDYGDGEAAQEYEGVYQGGYFDGVNHAGYYAGANYHEGINNLYEDVF